MSVKCKMLKYRTNDPYFIIYITQIMPNNYRIQRLVNEPDGFVKMRVKFIAKCELYELIYLIQESNKKKITGLYLNFHAGSGIF